jgi:hypothetical protein
MHGCLPGLGKREVGANAAGPSAFGVSHPHMGRPNMARPLLIVKSRPRSSSGRAKAPRREGPVVLSDFRAIKLVVFSVTTAHNGSITGQTPSTEPSTRFPPHIQSPSASRAQTVPDPLVFPPLARRSFLQPRRAETRTAAGRTVRMPKDKKSAKHNDSRRTKDTKGSKSKSPDSASTQHAPGSSYPYQQWPVPPSYSHAEQHEHQSVSDSGAPNPFQYQVHDSPSRAPDPFQFQVHDSSSGKIDPFQFQVHDSSSQGVNPSHNQVTVADLPSRQQHQSRWPSSFDYHATDF